MADNITQFPRSLRAIPNPLALYLRPGHNDHCQLSTLLLSGTQKVFGAVIDATIAERHKELRDQLASNRLHIILDPRTQPAALPGGFKPSHSQLPWGEERPHIPSDFQSLTGRQKVIKLAEYVIQNGFTQVMSPSHVIFSPNDPWLAIDLEATRWLRTELDRRGGKHIPVIYSLAVAYSVIKDTEQRAALIGAIHDLPVNSIWLKIDGFGSDATPTATSKYIDAAAEFHALGIPLVADHVGGIPALSLLAFGAVGGIAHGITTNEGFKSYSWRKPQKNSGGASGWRIYLPSLDLLLPRQEAELLLGSSPRAKALFANRNTLACPRGVDDMLENPFRSFVVQRAHEVAELGLIPDDLRPQTFLDSHVRPVTDRILAASKIRWNENESEQKLSLKLSSHRKRMDDHRIALGERASRRPPQSFALPPQTLIARESR